MKDFEFSMDLCLEIARAAQEAQKEIGVSVSMAIVDWYGSLRYFYRFGDAILPSVEISQKKAYTSAVLGLTTYDFGKIAQPGESAFGINTTCPDLVIFGGGVPLQINGKTVGGIGISGASAQEDEIIAERALEAFRKSTGGTEQ